MANPDLACGWLELAETKHRSQKGHTNFMMRPRGASLVYYSSIIYPELWWAVTVPHLTQHLVFRDFTNFPGSMDQGISVHQPLGIWDTYGCSTVISQQKRGCSHFHNPKTTPDLSKFGDWPSPTFSYNTTILGSASHLVSAVYYNPYISHIIS